MTIIHANDPTTKVLSQLYESEDKVLHITEASTNVEVINALRADTTIMMLGHGNKYGLFSKPDKKGKYERFLITDRHVQFLRGKTCIAIWCHANEFAEKYHLKGLFSGMIISELQEAAELNVQTTQQELSTETEKFASRLRECISKYPLKDIPSKMRELDDVKSELTRFNYSRLFYYDKTDEQL